MVHLCSVAHSKLIASLGLETFKVETGFMGRLTSSQQSRVPCPSPIISVTSALFKAELEFLMLSASYTSLPEIAALYH